jgi:hypothetical protein
MQAYMDENDGQGAKARSTTGIQPLKNSTSSLDPDNLKSNENMTGLSESSYKGIARQIPEGK